MNPRHASKQRRIVIIDLIRCFLFQAQLPFVAVIDILLFFRQQISVKSFQFLIRIPDILLLRFQSFRVRTHAQSDLHLIHVNPMGFWILEIDMKSCIVAFHGRHKFLLQKMIEIALLLLRFPASHERDSRNSCRP